MTLTFIANMQFVAMIDQINEQLPSERQISLIGANLKTFKIIRLYRVMCPDGKLNRSFFWLGLAGVLLGLSAFLAQFV